MYQYRRPPRPPKPKVPMYLYIILAFILLISSGVIINYIRSDFMYNHGHTVMALPPEPYMPALQPPPPEPTAPPAEPEPTPELEPTPEPEPTPDPGPTPPPRVQRQEFLDWRIHYGNNDIIGHLYVPNTTINYLVTQTTDNSFYLYHDIRGRRSAPGWIFLDYLVDLHGQDQNMVIYGHNMGRNHMFHGVRHFKNENFFHNNRYLYFSTIYADYVFEVFSVYITHINFQYTWNNFDEWDQMINIFQANSWFSRDITLTGEDRVLTLSTCDNSYRNNRIVVHGVLVSETFPHLDLE